MTKHLGICGISNRGVMTFALPLLGFNVDGTPYVEDFSSDAVLEGFVEPDIARAAAFDAWLHEHGRPPMRRFDSIDQMAESVEIDSVIVASPDHTHHDHVLDGLRRGLHVFCEKPMVTTTEHAQSVIDAEASSRGRVTVTHNYRYPPRHMQLKELIDEGRIGTVVQVLMEYHVDTSHGSSYYVRWNRTKAASGGLTLHKSTHHLDLLNWLIGREPQRVFAEGGQFFYGADSPHRPVGDDGGQLTGAGLRDQDPFWQEMTSRGAILTDASGRRVGTLDLPYPLQYPDDKVFTVYDDEIDSVDTISAVVGYGGGVSASYVINFASPWEGFRMTIVGTHGQLEAVSGHVKRKNMPENDYLTWRPLFGEAEQIPVEVAPGGHGGADPVLLTDLFRGPSERSLRLGLPADAWQGGLAVALGEGLWRSAELGEVVPITLSRPNP